MPVPSSTRNAAHTNYADGLWFQATTAFCIVGLNVPNPGGETLQHVQVILEDSQFPEPPTFASGGSVFYSKDEPAGQTVAVSINVANGKYVGLFGSVANNRFYYAAAPQSSSIDGNAVELKGLTANGGNLANSQITEYANWPSGELAIVEMYYTPGTCGSGGGADGDPHFLTWSHEVYGRYS